MCIYTYIYIYIYIYMHVSRIATLHNMMFFLSPRQETKTAHIEDELLIMYGCG